MNLTDLHRFIYRFECSWKDKMGWFCSWLYTPRNDDKPRMLKFYDYPNDELASFIERIKKAYLFYSHNDLITNIFQDFKEAKHAVNFFIYAILNPDDNVEDISFEDVKTNEKLVIEIKVGGDGDSKILIIARYPLKAKKNWIEANEKEIAEWDGGKLDRKINVLFAI
jgi:hypothetical protein